MKKSVMQKWTKALKSGEYLQGKNYLAQVNKDGEHEFCCLGVLCNIYQEETGNLKVEQENETTVYKGKNYETSHYEYDGNASLLPIEVRDYADMVSRSGRVNDGAGLTTLNDSGMSFVEIAKIIKDNYKEL